MARGSCELLRNNEALAFNYIALTDRLGQVYVECLFNQLPVAVQKLEPREIDIQVGVEYAEYDCELVA